MTAGDGLAANVGEVAAAAAGLLDWVAALVWLAWACAASEPAKVITVTLGAGDLWRDFFYWGSAPPCDLRIRPRIYMDVPLHHVCPTRSCWESVNVCAVT